MHIHSLPVVSDLRAAEAYGEGGEYSTPVAHGPPSVARDDCYSRPKKMHRESHRLCTLEHVVDKETERKRVGTHYGVGHVLPGHDSPGLCNDPKDSTRPPLDQFCRQRLVTGRMKKFSGLRRGGNDGHDDLII